MKVLSVKGHVWANVRAAYSLCNREAVAEPIPR